MRPAVTWMIILAVLVVLAMVRVGVRVFYEEKKLRLELVISKFKLVLMGEDKPKKKKKEKPKKEKSKKEKPAKEQADKKKADKPKKKGNILENPWVMAVLDYWRELLALVGRVLTSPTLDVLRLQLWVGGGDSEKCAMTYGRVCAILGGVLPVVENTFGIRKRQIEVWCCYDRDSIDVSAEAAITIRIYEIFALVFALLGLGIKIFLQARKYKKAVQNT